MGIGKAVKQAVKRVSEKERKELAGIRKIAAKRNKKANLHNKKLRDCKIHLNDKKESDYKNDTTIFITEGDSASGSITKVRNVKSQAVFSLRGKPLNTLGMKKKIVYVCMSADILHAGHINILERASKLGNVVVGLMTDQAISYYKKIPFLNYYQRELVIRNLNMVHGVVPQNTMDYRPNLRKIKPDYVVHGDDWKNGVLKENRSQVIKEIKKWSGKLVEFPYTKNVSSTNLKESFFNKNTMFFECKDIYAVDIDNIQDFEYAEYLLKRQSRK